MYVNPISPSNPIAPGAITGVAPVNASFTRATPLIAGVVIVGDAPKDVSEEAVTPDANVVPARPEAG